MNIQISEIEIHPVKPNQGLVGFASFVINDSIYVSSIAIHTKLTGGYRLTYPTKTHNNKQLSLFYPITKEVGLFIESAISKVFEEVMNKHDRHDSTYIK